MHQHNRSMWPAPGWLPEHSVQRRWAIGGLFARMRGDKDGLRLRYGRRGDKRQEQEHEAQHNAMEKQPRMLSQHKVLPRHKTR